jgi:hypothetical protein
VTDFRSQRSPSPEGQGIAAGRWRKAWDAYSRTVNKAARPLVEPAAEKVAWWYAGKLVEDLAGFWLLWHLEGGFEGLQKLGMSRSAIYRRVTAFRKHFGVHPDEYRMPGVTIDLPVYLAARAAAREAEVTP